MTPPPIPAGAWIVDLYGPSGRWITSTPATDRTDAARRFDDTQHRVRLPGAVALVQHGPDVVLRAVHAPEGWQLVEAPSP